jgi:hypothetical protein
MIDCVAIGDEIATGVSAPLSCEVRTAPALTSSRAIEYANGIYHAYCVISAGSYDPGSSKLASNLLSIRNESNCKFYVWIVPANTVAASVVSSVASLHKDTTVNFTVSNNGISPTNYNTLASSILNATNN